MKSKLEKLETQNEGQCKMQVLQLENEQENCIRDLQQMNAKFARKFMGLKTENDQFKDALRALSKELDKKHGKLEGSHATVKILLPAKELKRTEKTSVGKLD